MKVRIFTAIALSTILTLQTASADEAVTPQPAPEAATLSQVPATATGAELTTALQDTDESVIRQQGLDQAEQIRAMPDQMAAQGTPLTDEQKARFSTLADQMTADANSPGFKDRVISAMQGAEHGLKRAGIDIAKGIGYGGGIVFTVSVAPFIFGTDLVSSMITGRGQITVGGNNNLEAIIGYSGGIAIYYYVFVGLKALGYTMNPLVIASSLGVVVADELICTRLAVEGGTTELDQFCDTNNKLMKKIAGASARAGNRIGGLLHKPFSKACDGTVDAFKWLRHLFHHSSDIGSLTPCEPVPSPSPSASAEPLANLP